PGHAARANGRASPVVCQLEVHPVSSRRGCGARRCCANLCRNPGGARMSLIDEPAGGMNVPEFSVSEISAAVKRAVEQGFAHIRVRGEVGRVSRPRSGHVYLDLKDDRAVLAGIIWRGAAAKLATQPEEGMEVI